MLEEAGFQTVVFDEVQPNPTLENVKAGVRLLKEEDCDFIVAVGGGSANDCAKAVRLLEAGGGCLEDYQGGIKVQREGKCW